MQELVEDRKPLISTITKQGSRVLTFWQERALGQIADASDWVAVHQTTIHTTPTPPHIAITDMDNTLCKPMHQSTPWEVSIHTYPLSEVDVPSILIDRIQRHGTIPRVHVQ